MGKLYFEKIAAEGDYTKFYFVSYLRADFVERSMVMTLNKNRTVKEIYFSSYEHGSTEWFNGEGLVESRQWESDEQAVSSTYLTRRYTVRMADGPVKESFAEQTIIPDILDNMADENLARVIRRIVKKEKYMQKIIADASGFLSRGE